VLVLDGRLGASCGDDRVTVSSLGSRDISTITVTGRANPLDVADRQLDLEADKFLLASCHNILEQEYLVTVPESAAAAVAVPVTSDVNTSPSKNVEADDHARFRFPFSYNGGARVVLEILVWVMDLQSNVVLRDADVPGLNGTVAGTTEADQLLNKYDRFGVDTAGQRCQTTPRNWGRFEAIGGRRLGVDGLCGGKVLIHRDNSGEHRVSVVVDTALHQRLIDPQAFR